MFHFKKRKGYFYVKCTLNIFQVSKFKNNVNPVILCTILDYFIAKPQMTEHWGQTHMGEKSLIHLENRGVYNNLGCVYLDSTN